MCSSHTQNTDMFAKWIFSARWSNNFWVWKLPVELRSVNLCTESEPGRAAGWGWRCLCSASALPGCLAVKNPSAMQEPQEVQVWSRGLEDALENGMANHSNILVWRIPWTEEPGGLHSMGSQRVGHNWSDLARMHILCISGSQACLCIIITWEAFLVNPDPPLTDLIYLAWGKALAIKKKTKNVLSDGCNV